MEHTMISYDIYVRDSAGAYVTNTVARQRASATMSAEAAARRLAAKLFGDKPHQVELMGHASCTGITRYQAREQA